MEKWFIEYFDYLISLRTIDFNLPFQETVEEHYKFIMDKKIEVCSNF